MEATIPTPLAGPTAGDLRAPGTAAPDEPSTSPDAPRDRLAWGFPAGCALVAALGYALSWFVAPRLSPDPYPAVASTYFAFATDPIGEASVLPMPFLTPVPPPSAFLTPPPSPASGRVTPGALTVSGRLPPAVVARVLRQNHGHIRRCYEAGLRHNPNLLGRVATRFVIGRDGAVTAVGNGGSDLPDGGVVQCVVGAVRGMAFPAPEGGLVTVIYPLTFSPS